MPQQIELIQPGEYATVPVEIPEKRVWLVAAFYDGPSGRYWKVWTEQHSSYLSAFEQAQRLGHGWRKRVVIALVLR